MPKGPLTTQYICGIVADQLSKMVDTFIGYMVSHILTSTATGFE